MFRRLSAFGEFLIDTNCGPLNRMSRQQFITSTKETVHRIVKKYEYANKLKFGEDEMEEIHDCWAESVNAVARKKRWELSPSPTSTLSVGLSFLYTVTNLKLSVFLVRSIFTLSL